MIDKATLPAPRAALPARKITPNSVSHREGGIPPASIPLEANRLQFAAGLGTLDDQNLLRSRDMVCSNVGTLKHKKTHELSKRPVIQISRIQQACKQLSPVEAAHPLPAQIFTSNPVNKLEVVEAYREWIGSISPVDKCAYSDGSSEGLGRSSWGFILRGKGKTFEKGHGFLHGSETHDAEMVGATKAPEVVILAKQGSEKMFMLLDNQAVTGASQTGRSSSCLGITRGFYDIVCDVNAEVR